MANIILSTPAQQRQGVQDNRVARVEDQAAYQAAEGLRALSEAVGAITRREQKLKAAADAAQVQAELSVWLKEQEASGNVDNLAARLKEEKDKRFNKLNAKSSSAYYRDFMNESSVSVYAGLVGQAENTEINGRFAEQQARLEKLISEKNTYVMNNPAMWKVTADETEALIHEAVLPAETKAQMVKRMRHNYAYDSALTDLRVNPEKLKQDVLSGVYEGSLSAEEQFNYLSGSENNIFKALLEGDTVDAENFIKENKGYFKTIPEEEALKKIKEVRVAREKEVVSQDKINRALSELDFWNDPTWGKLETFDFRGDETKKEKWQERLAQVPNPGARTVYGSVNEIADAINALTDMPAETKDDQAALIEKASDLTAAIGNMNATGDLSIEDAQKYTETVGKIAINGTLRKDLLAMRPKLETFKTALKSANSIKDKMKIIAAEQRAYFGAVTPAAEKILADGYANFVKEIAAGNKDSANMIYKEALVSARNVLYPAFAEKEKGDVVIDGNGTVMVLAGFDGIEPIVEAK